ncbi:MAG: Uma2 family endonuclease [Bryobacterales bacterium]|nr:Uma2 family endonuclease [Bryobacterales bacterium]
MAVDDCELVHGTLVPLPVATPRHAMIRARLERLLSPFFDAGHSGGALGDVDCRTQSETVRRPDVSIFLGSSFDQIDLDVIPIPYVPTIAVEVLSPSESITEVHRKTLEYLEAGSQEVWQLDPVNQEIFVQTPAGIRMLRGSQLLESPLLPGFSARVDLLLAGRG